MRSGMKEFNVYLVGYECKYVVCFIVVVVSCLCVLFGCDFVNKDVLIVVVFQLFYQDFVYDGVVDFLIVWDK